MKKSVADASILIKLFIPESGSEKVKNWARVWRSGNLEVLCPQLVVAEFANVIWHKVNRNEIERSIGRDIIKDFCQLPIRIIDHKGIIEAAFTLANQLNITIYDSLYATLAYKISSEFVTADQKLADKLKSSPIITKVIR